MPVCETNLEPRNAGLIIEDDLERQLSLVSATIADPTAGLFGPRSVTWRVNRESVLFLGAGRALLLQLAHPWVAAAISEHSRTLADPIGRFHRTFGIMFSLRFGSAGQAFDAARRLHRRHALIHGQLAEAAGPFPVGSQYWANELDALRWVHATLTETALLAHDLGLPPISDGEREYYYAESKRCAALFGIPQTCLPADWVAFAAYNKAMWGSEVLTVTAAARAIAYQMFASKGSSIRVPNWYRAVTAHLLPERLRNAFGLPYGVNEQQTARQILMRVRQIYPLSCSLFQGAGAEIPCLSVKLFSVATVGQDRKHDHETTVDHALMRGLVTAGPVMRRGASSV